MPGPIKNREVRRCLENKLGFTKTPRHDHPEYELVIDGEVLATTHVSHGKRGDDIGVFLVGQMASQIGVSQAQFRAMVSCTMSKKEYLHIVVED